MVQLELLDLVQVFIVTLPEVCILVLFCVRVMHTSLFGVNGSRMKFE